MTLKSMLLATGVALAATGAHSAVVGSFTQNGTDVLFQFAGSIDLTGMSTYASTHTENNASVKADNFFGTRDGTYRFWSSSISGPTGIGSGSTQFSTTDVTGDIFFLNTVYDNIGLATTYTSGSHLSGSATFAGTTLAGLGLTGGTYLWTLANSDTIELTVGATVPVPASGALLLGALAAGAVARRKLA